MRFLTVFPFFLILAAASVAGAGGKTSVITATEHYVAANSGIGKVHVVVEKVSGNYARAKVAPSDPEAADAAWVFLRKQNGAWIGVTLGTSFSPDDYRELGIPRVLWIK